SKKPFVPVNCGALPADLVEDEVSGHERSAYTGASRAQSGLIEEADGGTLFLGSGNAQRHHEGKRHQVEGDLMTRRAARAARKNRRAFWELIRKHQIDVGRFKLAGC
ncbi:MAG: sigma-54 factor interaction domain-containing protein, partial [bacterium]|nr:sigma-54 factor interaction domain-containing protein [bacterium]